MADERSFFEKMADVALAAAAAVAPGASGTIEVAQKMVGLIDEARHVFDIEQGDEPAIDEARTALEFAVNKHVDGTIDALRGKPNQA